MVDACFQGMEQSDVGDETERFPRLSYGRHTLEVQDVTFNAGYRGKHFIVQQKVLASTDLAKQPLGESRVFMLKMDATHPEAQKIRRGEVALFLGVMNDCKFPEDKARFDQQFLPQISRILEYATSPQQPYKGKVIHCTVSWQSAKGADPLSEGYPLVKFYPSSVPVDSLTFTSPPPGFKPYVKPGTAAAAPPPPPYGAPPPAWGAPPAAQPWVPPAMPPGYGAPPAAQPWAPQVAPAAGPAPWQPPAPIAAPPPAWGSPPAAAAQPWQQPPPVAAPAAIPPCPQGVDPAQWFAFHSKR